MSVIIMGFKDRLKELRSKKRLTQEALAAALEIPESTIRRYESSDDNIPRRERLEKIADYFGVSVDYLLGRTDDPAPSDKKDDKEARMGLAFITGGEDLTEEEAEYLKESLELFRRMKERRAKEREK
ncbi:helix-turn-helix domain-containing protein [Brevibacillus agri]|uniref:Helix-turn-helix domain-containing protein n=1 Tax=Brevibacillus brevis TaxID=1393 RepID=A0ABY9T1K5_BREBE|nr:MULTISPECIES: helix-turn-helix domain-containing protein [Brevibacillus]MCG5251590.1 helix-turn-helix domain-containing protein [Brevibacillus agri]MED4572621.1 helix-turn-helix domain-containing protein [Brevibacillus agri]WNC13131.1 helix-turn-helix domain-containing protein [Brevibacillus brevis]